MIRSHLVIAIRMLYRDKAYAFINILGLAIGCSCCIILGLYVKSELTYDRHFSGHESIFRISSELTASGRSSSFAQTSYALGPLIADRNPSIESYARFSSPSNEIYHQFRHREVERSWENIFVADSNAFDIFDHNILYGNSQQALIDPNSIAVSEKFAKTYFGDENPVGKVIEGGISDYIISLVFRDLPDNTHLKYDVLLPYSELAASRAEPTLTERVRHDLWYGRTDYTYVKMSTLDAPSLFEAISNNFYDEYMASYEESFDSSVKFFLEPLGEIHLSSTTQGDLARGSTFNVISLIVIALLILVIASINYVVLSTARFSKRSKEIEICKLLGANENQLGLRFVVESFLFVVLALLAGFVIADAVLSYTSLNLIFGKSLAVEDLSQSGALGSMIFGVVVVALVAGLYPAISSVRSISKPSSKHGGLRIRNGLIFVQFLISISVISCSLLMYFQINYVYEKPLGFDKQNKLSFTVVGADNIMKINTFREEILKYNNVFGATVSRGGLGNSMGVGQAEIETNNGLFETQSYNWFYIDDQYVTTLGINIVEGRNFEADDRNDLNDGVLVNETLASRMNWEEPIGKAIKYDQGVVNVIGVMNDFHFRGLQHEVEPIMFWLTPQVSFEGLSDRARSLQSRNLTISISEENQLETIQFLSQEWDSVFQDHSFKYRFLGDVLDRAYESDRNQMILVGLFALLSILISCLGLFGLSAYVIEKRTKEIGLRKVLGASTSRIILMLFRSMFLVLVAASLLASILSFWVFSEWLGVFFYKVDINLFVFPLSAFAVMLLAFATVTIKSWKISRSNPVEALRYE